MKEFVSGFCRSVGLLLMVCSLCLATTGAMADVVVVAITHNCNVGGSAPNNCTCSGKCNNSQTGKKWDCICGVLKHKNGVRSCACLCIKAGSAC